MDTDPSSADLYQDGTVPADADLVTPSAGSAGMDDDATEGAAGGATGGDPDAANPTKLVEGNRVATAEDME